MRNRLAAIAVALCASVALVACGGSGDRASGGDAGSGGTTAIKIGYPSDTASYGDLYVCIEQGIFKRNGLDVELTLLKTSSQLLAALTSGSVQISGGDGRAIAAGALKGTDVKIVALKLPAYFTEMWGRPEITSIEQLKGRKVGVTAPGSVTDAATRIMLKDKGLENDVQVVNFNSLPALLAAGKSGAIDALVTAPPQGTETRTFGWHKITDMTEYKTAASVYAVSGAFAQKNPDTVRKFIKSEIDCLAYLQKNRESSIDAIQKYTKTEDRSLAEYAYDFFKKIWVTDPTVDPALIQQTFEEVASSEGGQVPRDVSRFIDNSFIDGFKKDGYLDQANKS